MLPLCFLSLPWVPVPAGADDSMPGMTMDHSSPAGLSESSQAYMAAMRDMHKDMEQGVKAHDPDVAFAQGMIPHHQGAIAMAETELKYGKDPHMRQMAENVIKAQKAEIDTMENWLKAHPDKGH
ncbi:CopM family metallochaperone [Acerihabitans arboris]